MLTVQNHRIAGSALLAYALIGCEAFPDPPEPDHGAWEAQIDDYISHQGTPLLAFKNDDVQQFNLALPNYGVDLQGQLRVGSATGQHVRGQRLRTSTGIEMVIAEVHGPGYLGASRWQYQLMQYDPREGWVMACDERPADLPVPDDDLSLAYAMPGRWESDGGYTDLAQTISFACRRGVVAKCMGWGYDTTPAGAAALQACTRMARADYCADGVDHTFDGTPIHQYRDPHEPRWNSNHPAFVFEAAWPKTMSTVNGRVPGPAICLSKLRWSSLPLGGDCPIELPDPRTGDGKYCDELTALDLEGSEALVMVNSAYIDVGLYTWNDLVSKRQFTTTAFLPASTAEPRPGAPEPVAFPPAALLQRFEGGLYNLDPSNPLTDFLRNTMVQVRSFRCGNDYVTTTADLSSSCTPVFAAEGLAYPPHTPGRTKLRRWWKPMPGRSSTTTESPATMIAEGWQLIEVIGGMVRADPAVNVRWDAVSGALYSLDVQTRNGAWVAPCIGEATLRSRTMVTLPQSTPASPNVCPSATGPVLSGDIIGFRINYHRKIGSGSVQVPHDGVATDVYIEIPGGSPTALTLSWNAQGPRLRYAVDLHVSGEWRACATEFHLANDNELVLPASCPDTSATFTIADADHVRVCAAIDGDGTPPTCTDHVLDSTARHIALELPPISIPE